LFEFGGGANILFAATRSDNPASQADYLRSPHATINMRYGYFFGSHWGMYVHIQVMTVGKKQNQLYQKYISPYENRYYLSNYTEYNQDGGGLLYTTVGISYRMRWNRWALYSRAGVGGAERRTTTIDLTLKGKENNEVYQVSYNSSNHTPGILSVGTTVHYHLSRRISIYMDAAYMQSYQRPVYTFRQTNLYNEEIVTEKKFKAPHQGHLSLNMGIGIHL